MNKPRLPDNEDNTTSKDDNPDRSKDFKLYLPLWLRLVGPIVLVALGLWGIITTVLKLI